MIHRPPYRGPNRWYSRDRFDLANGWRLIRQLQGALNRLADLRDTLEKFHEARPVHSKRNI